jgi:hypothetical protein
VREITGDRLDRQLVFGKTEIHGQLLKAIKPPILAGNGPPARRRVLDAWQGPA